MIDLTVMPTWYEVASSTSEPVEFEKSVDGRVRFRLGQLRVSMPLDAAETFSTALFYAIQDARHARGVPVEKGAAP